MITMTNMTNEVMSGEESEKHHFDTDTPNLSQTITTKTTTKSTLIKPFFHPSSSPESSSVHSTITTLSLTPHIEGGYFTLTHLHPTPLPSPYPPSPLSQTTISIAKTHSLPLNLQPDGSPPSTRLLSSTIFYYLTPHRPMGSFHRNRSPIIHSLHKGRGRYVLIHKDGKVETFIVGMGLESGERCQWVVEGGVWKASFLLPDKGDERNSEGLLITETVVPGFDYCDHEFLGVDKLEGLVTAEEAQELKWLIRDH